MTETRLQEKKGVFTKFENGYHQFVRRKANAKMKGREKEREREREREREKEKTLPRSTFRFLRGSENGQIKEKNIYHLASVTPNMSTVNLTPSPLLSKRET
ncbi:hypothetical protein POVCU2_0022880 [Plasmodium ovale curtisi]|uniref:Uncharacterized protein n=1 Tax=Plasmodium ovale curtisi TaxID=864141 RepID=A0A1A8VY63_PLAOA|nr:hypothetical protein POVCU2_0022880 [Plasmodium ovale curtisi]